MFNKGDSVFDVKYGIGQVVKVFVKDDLTVEGDIAEFGTTVYVVFGGGNCRFYLEDGRTMRSDSKASLFLVK
jgi:hypothetical protein